MPAKQLRVAQVTWEDSEAVHDWRPGAEFIEDCDLHCLSVGYLLRKDKKQVVLVQSLDLKNGNAGEGLRIPRSAVRKIEYLTG